MQSFYENVTVTILLYKENYDLISSCLNNLKKFKIVLVDNDNNINLKKKLEENFQIYKYILNKKNIGWSKGVNQAIKSCDTTYILNLSADCIIDEESILKLYEAINIYNNCFITTPTMINKEHKLTHSGGALIEKNLGYKVLNVEGDVCVDFPLTAAILFKKKEMIEVGLFDEDFFLYYPDFEIGRRIKLQKKSIIQIFSSRAVHSMGKLKIKNPIKRVFYRNYFYTLDGLIYFYKENIHHLPMNKLKNEILGSLIKSILYLFIFRLKEIVVCISKMLAYYNFKKRYLRNKD